MDRGISNSRQQRRAVRYRILTLLWGVAACLLINGCASRYNIAALSQQVRTTADQPLLVVVRNAAAVLPPLSDDVTQHHLAVVRATLAAVDVRTRLADSLTRQANQQPGAVSEVVLGPIPARFTPHYYIPTPSPSRFVAVLPNPPISVVAQPVLYVDYGFSPSFSQFGMNAQLVYKSTAEQTPFMVSLAVTQTVAASANESVQKTLLRHWADNPTQLIQAVERSLDELAIMATAILNDALPEPPGVLQPQYGDFALYDGRILLGARVLAQDHGRILLKYQTAPYRPALIATVDAVDIMDPPMAIQSYRAQAEADQQRQYWLQQSMLRHYELLRVLQYQQHHPHAHHPAWGYWYRHW